MATDYLPAPDPAFDNWQVILIAYLIANKVALGVSDATVAALTAAQTAWTAAYGAHQTAQAAATSKRQDKDDARAPFAALIRSTVGQMQANPAVTDTQRAAMQITVPSGTHTPAPVPTTRPVGTVDTSQRLSHKIEFRDESTPNSRAKPAGVDGCELYLYIGTTAPAGPEAMHLQAMDKSAPYLMEFASTDAGKTAFWAMRWVNTKGEHDPWSATVSGTIPG